MVLKTAFRPTWKDRARKLGIAAGDIELTALAFSAVDDGGGRRR